MNHTDVPEIPATAEYAVIFTSLLSGEDQESYNQVAERLDQMVQVAPGYCGMHSTRGSDGLGITVSYWTSHEAIRRWRLQAEHLLAQRMGRHQWYRYYQIHVARIERRYTHQQKPTSLDLSVEL